jgi:hypothetical protein
VSLVSRGEQNLEGVTDFGTEVGRGMGRGSNPRRQVEEGGEGAALVHGGVGGGAAGPGCGGVGSGGTRQGKIGVRSFGAVRASSCGPVQSEQ